MECYIFGLTMVDQDDRMHKINYYVDDRCLVVVISPANVKLHEVDSYWIGLPGFITVRMDPKSNTVQWYFNGCERVEFRPEEGQIKDIKEIKAWAGIHGEGGWWKLFDID